MNVVVHPADVQDRDGAFLLLRRARQLFPFIKRIFADGGYAGEKMALVVWRTGAWKLEIVKRADVSGFEVLPKRWIVERTFAWISRNRRLARDFERYAVTVAAFVRLAMIRIMLRRLALWRSLVLLISIPIYFKYSGKNEMTKTKVIFRFTQRVLWIYIAEAVIVLAIIMITHAYA